MTFSASRRPTRSACVISEPGEDRRQELRALGDEKKYREHRGHDRDRHDPIAPAFAQEAKHFVCCQGNRSHLAPRPLRRGVEGESRQRLPCCAASKLASRRLRYRTSRLLLPSPREASEGSGGEGGERSEPGGGLFLARRLLKVPPTPDPSPPRFRAGGGEPHGLYALATD